MYHLRLLKIYIYIYFFPLYSEDARDLHQKSPMFLGLPDDSHQNTTQEQWQEFLHIHAL